MNYFQELRNFGSLKHNPSECIGRYQERWNVDEIEIVEREVVIQLCGARSTVNIARRRNNMTAGTFEVTMVQIFWQDTLIFVQMFLQDIVEDVPRTVLDCSMSDLISKVRDERTQTSHTFAYER